MKRSGNYARPAGLCLCFGLLATLSGMVLLADSAPADSGATDAELITRIQKIYRAAGSGSVVVKLRKSTPTTICIKVDGISMKSGESSDQPSDSDCKVAQLLMDQHYFLVHSDYNPHQPTTRIFKGVKCHLREVRVVGATRLSNEDLLQNAPEPGGLFTADLARKFIENILRTYAKAGAPTPDSIEPEVARDTSTNLITLTIHITK